MATQKKIDTVKELTEKVGKTKSIIFADYKGLKHKQLEDLRKALKKVNAEFVVTKNRLLLKALGDSGKQVEETVTKETAAVFSYDDEIAGVKELTKFLKAAGFGKAKGGLLGKTVMKEKDVTQLSELPGKEQLLGNLVRALQSPISGLHYALSWNMNRLVWALSGVKEKKA